jgi:tight adherence protein C
MIRLDVMAFAALFLVGLAIFIVVYTFAKNRPEDIPLTGNRGLRRQEALAKGGAFKTTEPLLRLIASWIAPLPLAEQRRAVDKMITQSDDWLGLTPNEFFALSFISAVFGLIVGLVAAAAFDLPPLFAVLFMALGAILPHSRLSGEIQDRFLHINRTLPTAIDLVALCMGAGLDFPGALRQLVDKAVAGDNTPLTIEVQRILQELDLGKTRRQALENFAYRVPTDPVRDFVGSVVQAEEKGNPLADVLRIQADMLRLHRSIMAEENAAKSAIMMMIPLVLVFLSVILILMGPFFIKAMSMGK